MRLYHFSRERAICIHLVIPRKSAKDPKLALRMTQPQAVIPSLLWGQASSRELWIFGAPSSSHPALRGLADLWVIIRYSHTYTVMNFKGPGNIPQCTTEKLVGTYL